ncbi:uncharacterized protein LOC141693378 isoform X2 [Apium graveolens]
MMLTLMMLRLQVLNTRGHLLIALGYGLWPSVVLISEIVQTFISAYFCYYYVLRNASMFVALTEIIKSEFKDLEVCLCKKAVVNISKTRG